MTTRTARIRAAQEAGDAARAGNHLDTDDWVRRLPPASERMWRERLLESLSPAMREAVAAVNRPRPPAPAGRPTSCAGTGSREPTGRG